MRPPELCYNCVNFEGKEPPEECKKCKYFLKGKWWKIGWRAKDGKPIYKKMDSEEIVVLDRERKKGL